jgi:NitT/TauT family transport system substrate-binding protein
MNRRLNGVLAFFDTVGVAAFTVIGAKVAIVSKLDWYWAPILAALTCSGGSLISNAVTSHAPDVLMGELYEEVAAIGGLFMVAGLILAQSTSRPTLLCTVVVLLTLIGTFAMRWWVIKRSIKSPTLRTGASPREAA